MRSALRLCSLGVATLLGPLTPATPPAQAQDGDPRDRQGVPRDGARDGAAPDLADGARRPLSTARSRSRPRAAAAANAPSSSAACPGSTGRTTGATATRRRRPTRPTGACCRRSLRHLLDRNTRGIDGALMDLEYQRMELIKFNLFDNLTYETYVTAAATTARPMDGPVREGLEGDAACAAIIRTSRTCRSAGTASSVCKGPATRFRTVNGICNDINNPAMGSTGHAVRPQRAVRIDLSGPRPRRARAQPPRRAHLAAQARPAGDQPQAVHARPDRMPRTATRAKARPAPTATAPTRRRRSST